MRRLLERLREPAVEMEGRETRRARYSGQRNRARRVGVKILAPAQQAAVEFLAGRFARGRDARGLFGDAPVESE